MDGRSSNKRQLEAQREGDANAKRHNITMRLETLDCYVCSEPLRPPIFQCSVGHCICLSCREKLDKKCPVCSIKTSFKRCFAMEHVVQEAKVACSNKKYGCAEGVIYYQKEEHKKACPSAPCFCAASGCGFTGPTKVLLDHFLIHHKYASTILPDSGTVSLCLQPGLHVLRYTGTSYFFLLSMDLEPFGHAISVICIQPNVKEPKFKYHVFKERVQLLIFKERPRLKLLIPPPLLLMRRRNGPDMYSLTKAMFLLFLNSDNTDDDYDKSWQIPSSRKGPACCSSMKALFF
ncbi:putative E3 ubiquitin-protein ligase SINA-like protein 6 [Hordeum vulgare]|nr:putative E3 ubiquitin-protein ligase SINA-like protein 6 [Hordeum vulgare]